MTHRVIVPLVVSKNEDGTDLYLYNGATVPARVKGVALDRLVDGGFVVEDVEPEPEADEKPATRARAAK